MVRAARLCGMSANDLLAYETPKLVSVRDATVGGIYYLLLLTVFIYLILYQVFFNLGYLEFRKPDQTVRLSLKQPTVNECDPLQDTGCQDQYVSTDSLGYCCQTNCSTDNQDSENTCSCPWAPNGSHTYKCEYLDGARASSVQGNTVLVQTRFTRYEEERKNCNATHCDKRWGTVGKPKTRNVAGIENFTLTIDHSVLLQDFGIMKTNQDMTGYLHIEGTGSEQQALCKERLEAVTHPLDGDPTDKAPCYIQPRSKPGIKMDIFYVATILRAMGIGLDHTSELDKQETRRAEGFTVSLQIEYVNTRKWWGVLPNGQMSYIYHLSAVPDDHYNTVETIWKSFPTSRFQIIKYGILFSVSPSGLVGKFSYQQLLVTLTTGMALLAVCSIIIKHLSTKFLARHQYYSHYLIESSVSFGDIEHLETLSDEELHALLVSHDLKTKGDKKEKILRLLQDGFSLEANAACADLTYGTM